MIDRGVGFNSTMAKESPGCASGSETARKVSQFSQPFWLVVIPDERVKGPSKLRSLGRVVMGDISLLYLL